MDRPTDRIDWQPLIRVIKAVWRPVSWAISKLTRPKIKATDSGLFDPYVSLGRLKPLSYTHLAETPVDLESEPIESSSQPRRSFFLIQAVSFLIAIIFCFRLIALQITEGQANYQLAKGNATKSQIVPAPRGIIYDRAGQTLVANVPGFAVSLKLTDLPAATSDRQDYLNHLATLLGLSPADLSAQVDSNFNRKTKAWKKDQLIIVDNLSRDLALVDQIRLQDVAGTEITISPHRQYNPDIPGLGQILGYTGKLNDTEQKKFPLLAVIGKTGLEAKYDPDLQGQPGQEAFEVDSKGTTIRQIASQPPQAGSSLILSLDSSLQKTANLALADTISKNHAKSGAAAVMNVRTGEVLALASAPSFDNNLFSPTTDSNARQAILNDPGSPLLNRAIAGQYPSGSTIKPVYAASALQEGVINAGTKIDTSAGEIKIGEAVFHDWKVHGIADVKEAIATSNNIFFFTIGGGHGPIGGLGITRMDNYLLKFGFGKPTGIDLPGEQGGNVPTPDWLKKTYNESWHLGDTYNLSIGQGGLQITPLQLTRAISAIANGGTLYQPKLIHSIVGSNGQSRDIAPVVSQNNIIKSDALETVRQGMRLTVTGGSAAQTFRSFPVEIAAKTGTAQTTESLENTHAWFTAFGPYSSPEIAVSVIVEGGGEGWAVAAPVAKNIFEQYFHLPLSPINPAPPSE